MARPAKFAVHGVDLTGHVDQGIELVALGLVRMRGLGYPPEHARSGTAMAGGDVKGFLVIKHELSL